jgi:hypothetical protein
MSLITVTGRMVQGDLYTPSDKDADGNLRTIKTGPNAGKAKSSYFLAVAVPKTQAAWWSEPWGAQALAVVQQDWPRGEYSQRTDFAYKILDGDQKTSTGKTINNAAGCWVIRLESMVQPALWNSNASARLVEPNAIKRGYWVQVAFDYKGNGQATKPGMYANPVHVALAGYDEEIVSGPDVAAAGFGNAALPAHVSKTPIGGAVLAAMPAPAAAMPAPGLGLPAMPGAAMPAPAAAAMPAMPGVPTAATMPAPAAAAMPAMPGVPTAAAIVPNPAILVPPTPAPEVSYYHNGVAYTESALRGYGFTDAHFATMQRV